MDDEHTDVIDDEALWLVACLAHESARPDRLVTDPYAAHLAGSPRAARVFIERAETHRAVGVALGVAIVDELLHRAIVDHHLHAVVHLGAGLDTRPYRLGLPSDLRWVELDRDAMFIYKALRMAHAAPTCRVERVGVDLTDPAQRDSALRRVSRGITRGLLLTEHTLERFAPEALQQLGARLPAGLKWWMLGIQAGTPGSNNDLIAATCGARWQIAHHRPLNDEALRLAPGRLASLLVAGSRRAADLGAVWLLHHAA